MVHPQCRGYIHKLCFIQLATKPQFDLRTQLQIPSSPQSTHTAAVSVHTAADLLYHPKPSTHTAAEVIHAHSWDLTFLTKPLDIS